MNEMKNALRQYVNEVFPYILVDEVVIRPVDVFEDREILLIDIVIRDWKIPLDSKGLVEIHEKARKILLSLGVEDFPVVRFLTRDEARRLSLLKCDCFSPEINCICSGGDGKMTLKEQITEAIKELFPEIPIQYVTLHEGEDMEGDPLIHVVVWIKRTKKRMDPKKLIKITGLLREIMEAYDIDAFPLWHTREIPTTTSSRKRELTEGEGGPK